MRLFLNIVSIHEYIFAPRVTVQIAVKRELTVLAERSDQLLDGEVDWVQDAGRRFPSTIQVLA